MKKFFIAIVTVLLLTPAVQAFAAPAPAPADVDFTKAYTVGSDFSTVKDTTFDLTETPYLYLKLPNPLKKAWDSVLNTTDITFQWNSPGPGGFKPVDMTVAYNTGNQYWISDPNWSTDAAVGKWVIKDLSYSFLDSTGTLQTGSFQGSGPEHKLSFTVTPEPLSLVLMLLGAGALFIITGLRRKKTV